MGIPLSGGVPIDGGSVASVGLSRSYSIKRRVNTQYVTFGPYRAQHAPLSGSQRLEASVGPLAAAEERLFFSKTVQIAQGDVAVCLETGQRWAVIYVQVWPEQVEVWIGREGVPVPGNVAGAAPV